MIEAQKYIDSNSVGFIPASLLRVGDKIVSTTSVRAFWQNSEVTFAGNYYPKNSHRTKPGTIWVEEEFLQGSTAGSLLQSDAKVLINLFDRGAS